ncbi:MAG TPA: hypothetical protein VFP98_04260 [Candidatus Polarisedimenticolia bacterium]|nr:hypothetical protein [Candidatus Polarisedimenticolia bacterium]
MGWACMACGVGTGLLLGLWSFDGPAAVPAWIGDYGDTSRRLVRLGHIAFIGIGVLNVLLGRELPRMRLEPPAKRLASYSMNFGNILLPLALFAAGAWRPLKPLMAPPALAVFLALVVAAWGVRGGPTPDPHDAEDP